MLRRMIGTMCAVVFATALLFAQSPSTKSQPPASPYVGTWKLNNAKSIFSDKTTAPRSLTMKIIAADDSAVKWTATGTDARGRRISQSYTGPADGFDHPVTGVARVATVAYNPTGSEVDGIWKDAKGNVVGRHHISLSTDGKTMTIRTTINRNGKDVTATEVYDKVTET